MLRFLFLACSAFALAAQPQPEIRGVWIARDSLGTRERIAETMENLKSANFNVAYVLVWSQGYPLWQSEVFERETGLRIDPRFEGRDVLQEAIEEAKPRGLTVIPWFEYGFVTNYTDYIPQGKFGPVLDAHPDWIARRRDGSVDFTWAGNTRAYWMAHTHPDVQKFLLDLTAEIIARYDVPGLQFDRARYPELDCGYDDYTKALYAEEHEGNPPPDNPRNAEWMRWRAAKLNAFTQRLAQNLRRQNWRAVVTNAPIVFPFSYVNFLQEYPVWMKEGSLDFVSPQVYRSDIGGFERELDLQIRNLDSSARLVPGLSLSNANTVDLLIESIKKVRERGLPGVVVWYYGDLLRKDAFAPLRESVFGEPAPLPWK